MLEQLTLGMQRLCELGQLFTVGDAHGHTPVDQTHRC
jgi:hypothetical protein